MTDKNDLFGAVTQKKVSVPYATPEDLEKMQGPVPEEGVIWTLCLNHHSVFPITEEGREDLATQAGVSGDFDWNGKYISVTSCPYCSPDHRFENPVIRDFRTN